VQATLSCFHKHLTPSHTGLSPPAKVHGSPEHYTKAAGKANPRGAVHGRRPMALTARLGKRFQGGGAGREDRAGLELFPPRFTRLPIACRDRKRSFRMR